MNLKEWETREKREFRRYVYGFENNIKIYINKQGNVYVAYN